MIDKLDKWHQTKWGLLSFAAAELAIAYGFFSLSIDRGNIWWYILTLIFLFGAIQNIAKLIGKLNGKHKTSKA
jgi:hypothetical protein